MRNLKKLFCALLTVSVLISAASAIPADAAKAGSSSLLGSAVGEIQKGTDGESKISYGSADEMFSAMQPAAENSGYAMRFNPENGVVAVQDKQNGAIYATNAFDASDDSYATGDIKKSLESQLVLTYINVLEREQKLTLYSSVDCFAYGQYSYQLFDNGLRFTMTVGKDASEQVVPIALTADRYKKLYSAMSMRGQGKMEIYYSRYSLKDEKDKKAREELLKKYPALEKQDLYIAIEMSDREKKELEQFLKDAGYTAADMAKDYESLGMENESAASATFTLALEYALTADGLQVSIPADSVSFRKDTYQLLTIRVLEYFGTDKPIADGSGYLFYPDGSGAVIEMANQNENRRRIIASEVYGFDAANELDTSETEGEQVFLPVFGIRRNDGTAFLSVITEGDAVSAVSAKLGAPNGAYYTVYNTFTLSEEKHQEMDSKVSSLGSKRLVYLYEKNNYAGNMTLAYHLLPGTDSSYSDMAAVYRSYLIEKGMRDGEKNNVSLSVESIGTSLYDESFLGFTYSAQAKYTTYADDMEIIRYFADKGITNLRLSLVGWQKNGLNSMAANKLRVSGALGGSSGLKKLISFAAEQNVTLYPQVDPLFAWDDRLFDGFSHNSDSVRRLDSTIGGISDFDFATQDYRAKYYAITPQLYTNFFTSFFKGYEKLGTKNVTLTTVGTNLNSDFSRKNASNRSETQAILAKQMEALAANYTLAFDGGNAYVLPYASSLEDVPTECSGFLGESYSVPFLQMVVGGGISYSSRPVNQMDDAATGILRCIETGTSPDYIVTYGDVEKLKNTLFNKYYSTRFAVQKELMSDAYTKVADALSETDGTRLVSHSRIADGVFASVFGNGAVVYVNYNTTDYTVGAVTVPALGYAAA